ncbi:PKD repeat-containing protein [Candidatus Methanophagaceae archaeon]|nr:PKD repeat-containing protein [Methanophagales archaeon]
MVVHIVKSMERHRRVLIGTVLTSALLILVLLAGSASATTIEEKFVVSQGESVSIEFPVDVTGTIYAEIVDFTGYYSGLSIVLDLPSGETKEVWWDEFTVLPLSLSYEVSEDDIKTEQDWKISVVAMQNYPVGGGTLKITYPNDTTPPTLTLTCSPENPTADQQITFSATASDRAGIDRIEILVNARKVKECPDSDSCTYRGGPYPDYAGTSVSYGANAYDKAGNRAWTGYRNVHISEPRDTTPPTVIEHTPTGENVSVTTQITVTFSELMNTDSVEGALYVYDSNQVRVTGEFSRKENTMTFTPSSNLNYDTTYTVTIGQEAEDSADNNLEEPYEWRFSTATQANSPPNTPRLSGPTSGYTSTLYRYSTSTEDPEGDDMRHTFDWGDGTTSETEFVKSGERIVQSHAWIEPCEYRIRVRATDDHGASSRWSKTVVMNTRSSERQPPTAIMSATPTEINEGESISFSAEASRDTDGELVSYDWDFGDGDTSTGLNVEHAYTHSGHYTASLTVTDNDNLFATDTADITVEPTSTLTIAIFTDPVPSGESNEISVRVTANGNPVPDAFVRLSATIGELDPIEGVTNDDGGFVSIFHAPVVDTTETYTLYAEAEIETQRGEASISDLITITQNVPPTAYIEIYPNPATEYETVTFEGYGEDEDGEVVECRWTFPDGTTRLVPESSDYFKDEDAQEGWYSFAVRDNAGAWSEEVGVELEWETSLTIPWIWVFAAAVLAVAVVLVFRNEINKKGEGNGKEKTGTIYADSDPQNALVFLDRVYRGLSPTTVLDVFVGPHTVKFIKFGYFECEQKKIVHAEQTTPFHCDLREIPDINLKLSAEPTKITADGESMTTITISIEDNNGIPILVPEDVTVYLVTDIGTIESHVKIPTGHASVKATLTSSRVKGIATIDAKVKFLNGCTTVEFL